ncbi:ABC transporter ATP-binding protein [Candidatus Micrarchaeota archaeon]|nr:ABC transporter ATP-binding protein [Candidatus Micrarchaeota archaeon]
MKKARKVAMAPERGAVEISIQGVWKEFLMKNGRLSALEDISIDVRKGEFLCVIGPSGCGKSTLLSIIAGLTTPERGRVLIGGKEVKGPGRDRVVMFQESALFPWLTAIQNIEFGLKMKGVREKERKGLALHYLGLVSLERFGNSYIHELSGGMKQRVALARALAMDPEVLLMDEPFAALDALSRDQFHKELQEIWMKTGHTIIFVTHNVSEAVCLGDRVVLFTYRPGKVKEEFCIEYPRPRESRGAPKLDAIESKILRELEVEYARYREEMLHDGRV